MEYNNDANYSSEGSSNEDENKIEVNQISSFVVNTKTFARYYLVGANELLLSPPELSLLQENINYGKLALCKMNGFIIPCWKMNKCSIYDFITNKTVLDNITVYKGMLLLIPSELFDLFDSMSYVLKITLFNKSEIVYQERNVVMGNFIVLDQE